jgi:hypothetical protein
VAVPVALKEAPMRYMRGILIAGFAWLATGCMQFEYGITLEDDLSGTADMDIEIDLERVAYMSAFLQNAFTGEGGEPSAEQIEAARQELLEEMDEDDFSEESLREEIAPDLPDGVELVSAKADREELVTSINVRLAFDHVDRLKDVRLEDDDDGDDGGPVDAQPFDELEIVDQGDEVIIRMPPIDPSEEMEDIPWVSPEMLEKLMAGFGVTFSVTTPFDAVEHNATSEDGKMSGEAKGVYARLKR